MKSNAKIVGVSGFWWITIPWWHRSPVFYCEKRKHEQLSFMLTTVGQWCLHVGVLKCICLIYPNPWHVAVRTMWTMMTSSNWNLFRVTGSFVRGIHRSSVNFLHKEQWRGALTFLRSAPWINGRVNNGEPGDLSCHHANYDVVVMRGRCQDFLTNGHYDAVVKCW